jgi:hypothetical protein
LLLYKFLISYQPISLKKLKIKKLLRLTIFSKVDILQSDYLIGLDMFNFINTTKSTFSQQLNDFVLIDDMLCIEFLSLGIVEYSVIVGYEY